MCHMENVDPEGMCHMENVDFVFTPTFRVCVTWKTWTLLNANPEGMCHMENLDFV